MLYFSPKSHTSCIEFKELTFVWTDYKLCFIETVRFTNWLCIVESVLILNGQIIYCSDVQLLVIYVISIADGECLPEIIWQAHRAGLTNTWQILKWRPDKENCLIGLFITQQSSNILLGYYSTHSIFVSMQWSQHISSIFSHVLESNQNLTSTQFGYHIGVLVNSL